MASISDIPPQNIYVRLASSSAEAGESMVKLGEVIGSMNVAFKPVVASASGINSNQLNVNTIGPNTYTSGGAVGTWSTGATPFTQTPAQQIFPVDETTWQVGDERIAEFALIALVKEYKRKQDMIANRPKFTSVEQAEKWLEAVS